MTIFRTSITAFVETEETKAAVEQALSDRRLEMAVTDCKVGGVDAAVAFYTENKTPDLIVFETTLSGEALLESVGSLAEVCDEGTEVLVLGSANDVGTYRLLVSEGVSDYLVGPFNPIQIFNAIEAVALDPDAPPRGRVIAFFGARGGAGSSTVAHNVTWSLTHLFNDDAILLDLDLAFGTAGLAFNVEPQQGIQDALAQPDRLDEVLLQRYMAEAEEHIKLLPSPATLESNADINPQSIDTLLELVRRTAPFIVLDVPHGWTAWTQHVMLQADEIVLTSTLDLACLRDSRNLVDLLEARRANDAPVRPVINHQGAYRKTELSDKDFETNVGGTAALIIAHDPVLFGTAANNGQVIGAMNSSSKVVEGFNALAQLVSGMEPTNLKKKVADEPKPGPFAFLKKKGKG